jgi:hypothetical protein
MSSGNTIELTNYQGVVFAVQPAQSIVSDWDMARTMLYGGATYPWGYDPPAIAWVAVHKNGLAFHTEMTDNSYSEDQRFTNSVIDGAVWDARNNPNSRFSMWFGGYVGEILQDNEYGMSYPDIIQNVPIVRLVFTDGRMSSTRATEWTYNNNSNLIPTTFVQNADGSITMSCKDYNGKVWSYTFSSW